VTVARLARWCFQHRNVVLISWLIAVIALGAASKSLGSNYSSSFGVAGADSAKALSLLQSVAPRAAGDSDTIVWHVDDGSVRDPVVEHKLAALLADVDRSPSVAAVTGPYAPSGVSQISTDGRTAFATVTFAEQANSLPLNDIHRVIDLVKAAGSSSVEVATGGQAIERAVRTPPSSTAAVGVAAAAVVLFIAFGSLLATVLPLVTAIVALLGGLSAIALLSNVLSIGSFSPTLGALIGLGVGIDYALFIVTRYRVGLKEGLTPEEAAIRAGNTSGRAVLFAGGTVCVALLGLLVLGISFLSGAGIAAAVVVVFTVIAAITLLPALLSVIGLRVLSRRQRRLLVTTVASAEEPSGFWAEWSGTVQRRPKALAAAALVIMATLAIPAFSLTLGSSDQGNDRSSSTTRQAFDLLSEGFGQGFNGPFQVVATESGPADSAVIDKVVIALRSTPGVAAVSEVPPRAGDRVAILRVVPTTPPESGQTTELLSALKHTVIPAATSGSAVKVYIGGTTAVFADFATAVGDKLPLFLTVIIGLGFVLLLLAFRSLLVPLVAAAMNLLAVASALGVLVAVFQWGWLSTLLGRQGPIDAFLPVMMVAILFGLSMDYQVFLVSRMHEEWVHTRDNSRAVRVGQTETGRVITAAGTIMFLVFSSFVFGGLRVIAEFGLGLAVSVLLDAFVIRSVLVPAAMHLSGSANWWLPARLDAALPHPSLEAATPRGGAAVESTASSDFSGSR
jgi:putative drug exporter of the RND superfamily